MHLFKETYFSEIFMTGILYNIVSILTQGLLWPAQWVSPKMAAFIRGRQNSFEVLEACRKHPGKRLWMHCASLGEFEQGRPVLEWLRREQPSTTIVLTFFSPSGYSVRKHTHLADIVAYLPWDTKRNAQKFITLVQPESAFIVKSELWPNYMTALQSSNIKTYFIAAQFRPNQIFFKPYGGYMTQLLKGMTHIFVQNQKSLDLLHGIGMTRSSISGDTRFDRVLQQRAGDNTLAFLATFKGQARCIILGSSWPEDHDIWLEFMNQHASENLKFVIAPHDLAVKEIDRITDLLTPLVVRYDGNGKTSDQLLMQAKVLVLNTMGDLAKAYQYADVAYVGGAMGTSGLHNILEPATFGLPIVIGPNIRKFPEAIDLKTLGGLAIVRNATEVKTLMDHWINNPKAADVFSKKALNYVEAHAGATAHITAFISAADQD